MAMLVASMTFLWYYKRENTREMYGSRPHGRSAYHTPETIPMEYTTTLATRKPITITIGNFDGIHLGHQFLLHELRATARELGCTPVMVTFQPHTIEVIRPDLQISYLTTTEEKLALAQRYGGVEESIVIHFTREVAAMSAEAFMDFLCEHFQVQGLVVGEDFSLGKNRSGNVQFLQDYGQRHHIAIHPISLAEAEQARISSTRIRMLVSEGRIEEANTLLGHPLLLTGIVQHGDKRGRLIGFPTANIRPDMHKLLPANGVYAVHVTLPAETGSDAARTSTVYKGVANIGVRPTFNGKERLVEVHILDTDLDLYEKGLSIDFIAYLRSEQRFSGIDALKAQITQDVQNARQLLLHI